jgi:hypothetical protein
MNEHDRRELDLAVIRYVTALDQGDLGAVATVWEQAERDPELERALWEVDEALLLERDAAVVRAALDRCLPSAAVADRPYAPLTVADVAERLRRDPPAGWHLRDAADLAANERMLACGEALPPSLGLGALKEWAERLGLHAGERYWQAFRQAALRLRLAQEAEPWLLQAARPSRPPRGREPS